MCQLQRCSRLRSMRRQHGLQCHPSSACRLPHPHLFYSQFIHVNPIIPVWRPLWSARQRLWRARSRGLASVRRPSEGSGDLRWLVCAWIALQPPLSGCPCPPGPHSRRAALRAAPQQQRRSRLVSIRQESLTGSSSLTSLPKRPSHVFCCTYTPWSCMWRFSPDVELLRYDPL